MELKEERVFLKKGKDKQKLVYAVLIRNNHESFNPVNPDRGIKNQNFAIWN